MSYFGRYFGDPYYGPPYFGGQDTALGAFGRGLGRIGRGIGALKHFFFGR